MTQNKYPDTRSRRAKARGPDAKRRQQITVIAKQSEFDEQQWIELLTAIAAQKSMREIQTNQAFSVNSANKAKSSALRH
jgi:hypothetical protein